MLEVQPQRFYMLWGDPFAKSRDFTVILCTIAEYSIPCGKLIRRNNLRKPVKDFWLIAI